MSAVVMMTALFCTPLEAQNSPNWDLKIGPSAAQVYGAIAGLAGIATVGTILAVNHGHHTMTGCVFQGPDGLRLQSGGSRIYSLEGDAVSVKAGDKVKLHGSRVKKVKGSHGDQAFKVEKVKKKYGPCHATLAEVSKPAE